MFPELQSMIRFCQDATGIHRVYAGDIPEEREIPALCFPPPSIADGAGGTAFFQKTYTLSVKILHQDNLQAFSAAEDLADAIRYPRYLIPLLTETGEASGKYLRIEQLELQMIEKGVAQLTLKWSSHYSFTRERYEKIARFTLTERMKTGDESEKDRRA